MAKEIPEGLKKYINESEQILKNYFEQKIIEYEKIDPLVGEEAIRELKDFVLRPGKRIRGALLYHTYRGMGGQDNNNNNILQASVAIELLHSFFLVHDDIIDKSDERRNKPTIHKIYQNRYADKIVTNDKEHFGFSMALTVGDIGVALAYEALTESAFPPDRILKVIKKMCETIKFTAIGEMLDVVAAAQRKADEELIQRIHEYKTAKYTVEGPMHMGSLLQGIEDKAFLKALSDYAIPAGIAFQIKDDILGMFGAKEIVGKDITSDLTEAKQTLLILKALENGSENQKEKLQSYIGNDYLTPDDMEEVRKIIKETGSLRYSEEKAACLIKEAKEAITKVSLTEEATDFFLNLADYILAREY